MSSSSLLLSSSSLSLSLRLLLLSLLLLWRLLDVVEEGGQAEAQPLREGLDPLLAELHLPRGRWHIRATWTVARSCDVDGGTFVPRGRCHVRATWTVARSCHVDGVTGTFMHRGVTGVARGAWNPLMSCICSDCL